MKRKKHAREEVRNPSPKPRLFLTPFGNPYAVNVMHTFRRFDE
ncbi:hypothetical protein TSMEX_008410 [Taenia solium]|eukprot:TsM_000221000 transcript=TsM_000221000 gene=TsM_000221000